MDSRNRYNGRPGGLALDDFWDWIEAAFWKAVSKKKISRADFCRQMPGFLEHEALHLWRRERASILTLPVGVVPDDWDPIKDMVELFRREFETPSPEMVHELLNLRKRPEETCRMLRSRLERLNERTGILTEKEVARRFVQALPEKLRVQLEPVLWVKSPGGEYTLDMAFEGAERLDLAQALSARDRDQTGGAGGSKQGAGGSGGEAVAVMLAAGGEGCFRCGSQEHTGTVCPVGRGELCGTCGKQGHTTAGCWRAHPERRPKWASGKTATGGAGEAGSGTGGAARDKVIAALEAQVVSITRQLAELKRSPGATPAYLAAEPEESSGDQGCDPYVSGNRGYDPVFDW